MARSKEQRERLGDPALTTEKSFAASNHAFWHDLLPLGEHCVRALNQQLSRFAVPIAALAPGGERGVVNELAFRLFVRAWRLGGNPLETSQDILEVEATATVDYVSRMRQFARATPVRPGPAGVLEAQIIAKSLVSFFRTAVSGDLECAPQFRGCGWIDACEGDALSGGVLFEVKAGDRPFRMIDLRQVLSYTALNFASKQYAIHSVCLVNPRHGTFFHVELEDLCDRLAGRTAVEVMSEIVEYISEPAGRYRTG